MPIVTGWQCFQTLLNLCLEANETLMRLTPGIPPHIASNTRSPGIHRGQWEEWELMTKLRLMVEKSIISLQ